MRTGINRRTGLLVLVSVLAVGLYLGKLWSYPRSRTGSGEAESVAEFSDSFGLKVRNGRLVQSVAGERERVIEYREGEQLGEGLFEVKGVRLLLSRVEDATCAVEADWGLYDQETGNLSLSGNIRGGRGSEYRFSGADRVLYDVAKDIVWATGTTTPIEIVQCIGGRESIIKVGTLKADSEFQNIETTGFTGQLRFDDLGKKKESP